MKLLICGSRNIRTYEIVRDAIRAAQKTGRFYISSVIHGGAEGVDLLAEQFCRQGRLPTKIVRPDYKWGKRAPLMRNEEMVNEADVVLAIWDGRSRGTDYTIQYADAQGKPLFIVTVEVSPRYRGETDLKLETIRGINGNHNSTGDAPGEA